MAYTKNKPKDDGTLKGNTEVCKFCGKVHTEEQTQPCTKCGEKQYLRANPQGSFGTSRTTWVCSKCGYFQD